METEQSGAQATPENIEIPADRMPPMVVRVVARQEVVNDRTQIIAIYTCNLVDVTTGMPFCEMTPNGPVPVAFNIQADTGRRSFRRKLIQGGR